MYRRYLKGGLTLFLVAALLVVVGGAVTLAQGSSAPLLPHAFWGSVTDAEGQPVSSGMVEAYLGGEFADSIEIVNGHYGGPGAFDDKLVVSGTAEQVGQTIEFYVNGIRANETATYQPGQVSNLDLTVPVEVVLTGITAAVDGQEAVTLQTGATAQITVRANYSDGTTDDVTAAADYQSSNPGIATVSDSGLITAQAAGEAIITASYGGFTDQVSVTVEAGPLGVTATDPADGATGVAVGKTVTVTFNANVAPGDNYGGIALTKAGGDSVEIDKSISGRVLTIDPTANLAYSTEYTVTIPAGAVKDLAGNALAQEFAFSFTTRSRPSGGGGGGGGTTTQPLEPATPGTIGEDEVEITEADGETDVTVPESAVQAQLNAGETDITLDLSGVENPVNVTLPEAAVEALTDGGAALTIDTPWADLAIPAGSLPAGEDVAVSIAPVTSPPCRPTSRWSGRRSTSRSGPVKPAQR